MGIELSVPDHSTVSRRLSQLEIELPVVAKDQPRHVVVDSTGVKVYGEGEWKTRQHGVSKRRTWRKLHLGVDEATGEIVAMVVTTNDLSDGQVFPDLLEQIEEDIEPVSADGAYDQKRSYEEIRKRNAKAAIPPRKGARIWQHGNAKVERHNRDENLRRIRKVGRKAWKREVNYHCRSLAETTMFRFKTIFGANCVLAPLTIKQSSYLSNVLRSIAFQIAKPDTTWVED